jgi:hypothetical protein
MNNGKHRHPKCTRCHKPAPFVWWATSCEAEDVLPELALCESCVQIVKNLRQQYQHKQQQKAAAEKTKD